MSNLLALTALGDGDSVSHFISNSGNGVAQSTVSDWTLLGPGQLFTVRALAAFDDGRGPQLQGTIVIAMTVHDDGDAPFLYVGGFSIASSAALPMVHRYDGGSWSTIATHFNGSIETLASFDDGSGGGSRLFVAGRFTQTLTEVGSKPITRIARLVDSQWQSVDGSPSARVVALLPSVDIVQGKTPALLAASDSFAQRQGCFAPRRALADRNGDGIVDGADLGLRLGDWRT